VRREHGAEAAHAAERLHPEVDRFLLSLKGLDKIYCRVPRSSSRAGLRCPRREAGFAGPTASQRAASLLLHTSIATAGRLEPVTTPQKQILLIL